MKMRESLSVAKYFVVGPGDTLGRSVPEMVGAVARAGFTCIQLRAKGASAEELIALCGACAAVLAGEGKSESTALVVNDRLDVVLAARARGYKVDGVHVGQSDIPADVCRAYLGEGAIVGLSAPVRDLVGYVRGVDARGIDYFGVGPLHETRSKADCAVDGVTGRVVTTGLAELRELARVSPVPVVVGGGVKAGDLRGLAEAGVDGFFVISAVAGAADPGGAARELARIWDEAVAGRGG